MNVQCAADLVDWLGLLVDWLGLLADMSIPLVLCWLGFRAHKYVDKLTRYRRLSEAESMWRLEVFRELQSKLNDIFCYFTYQGNWSSMSPDDATVAKRDADRIVYMNTFLWSREFLDAYEKYTAAAFVQEQGPGNSFLFRANVKRHRENEKWEDSWKNRFVPVNKRIRREEFVRFYNDMMSFAVRDLGIVSEV